MLSLPPPTSNPLKALTRTDPPSSFELNDISNQIDRTTITILGEGPICNYEEELAVQTTIANNTKGRYEKAESEVDQIKEQEVKSEAESSEDCDFYKMDENNIHILREDLTEDFQSLARTHTNPSEISLRNSTTISCCICSN